MGTTRKLGIAVFPRCTLYFNPEHFESVNTDFQFQPASERAVEYHPDYRIGQTHRRGIPQSHIIRVLHWVTLTWWKDIGICCRHPLLLRVRKGAPRIFIPCSVCRAHYENMLPEIGIHLHLAAVFTCEHLYLLTYEICINCKTCYELKTQQFGRNPLITNMEYGVFPLSISKRYMNSWPSECHICLVNVTLSPRPMQHAPRHTGKQTPNNI